MDLSINTNGSPDLLLFSLGYSVVKLIYFSIIFGINIWSNYTFQFWERES